VGVEKNQGTLSYIDSARGILEIERKDLQGMSEKCYDLRERDMASEG
jgi:hypothetical protein